jgi:PadR family transcriptional regulator, regulatory protein AphA
MIKYILLGFLNYGPMTGYQLKQMINESSTHFWHAHHSQIYTTLRKMEADGLVTSELIQEESVPDRRVYTIGESGRQALRDWLNTTLTHSSPIKEELLVHLFFSAQRDTQDVLTELYLQLELHQRQAAAYNAISEHMAGDAPFKQHLQRDQVFWRLTLEMGQRYEAMYIAWLEEAIQQVKSL